MSRADSSAPPASAPAARARSRPIAALGSIVFTGLLFILTPLWGLAIALTFFLPYRAHFAMARAWAGLLLWLLRVLCGVDYVVEGREHLPSGAHVVLCKHSSSWETIAQMVVFPPQCWVLKHELMYVPFVGWGLKLLRAIAIDRGAGHAAVNQVVEQGKERLAQGLWVVIFPEGTRMPLGETRKYGVSGALLAQAAGCKVIPVAHDAGAYWPRRGLLKKPGTIRMVIGPPIDPTGLEPRDINARAQEWVEACVARLRQSA
jgi:1-acyl-sn-glycerol-3-phosphate acyltransferase